GRDVQQRHRKRKVTYDEPGHAHFLTYSCQGRLPLLSKDRSRQWVIEAMDEARKGQDFALWAYVVMPEHVHVLLWPRRLGYRTSHLLAALMRPASLKAKAHLPESGKAMCQ